MSVDTLLPWAYFWAILLAAGMMLIAIIFLVHFFVPRVMLRTYFREPYFSPVEVEFFTGFPFAYMRTVMFMRLVGWPSSGKKRGLTEVYKLAPPWFRCASRIIVGLLLVIYPLMVILGFSLLGAFCFLGHC